MKILCIVPSYKPAYVYGGPIESVARLCEGLIEAGQYVEVYTTTANGATELQVQPNTKLTVDGVPVTYFKRITKDPTHISPALWRNLYATCKQYDVVLIQSWWNVLVVVAALICHLRKVKVIVSPRGMLSGYILEHSNSLVKKMIHSSVGKSALQKSVFHATSDAEYAECKNLIPGWRGFMIPNIIRLPVVTVTKPANQIFTLLFLSRIHPKKGIEILMDALHQISTPVLLRIAGSGDTAYIEQLKQKAATLGVAHQIQWIGWKDRAEKFEEMANADLFVLPSYNENFANTVIESLHVGTPVLITDQVGLAAFVQKEKVGWVVPVESNAIAKKIEEIVLQQQQQLEWIRCNSHSLIQQHFSATQLISQYIQHFQQVFNNK